MVGIYKIENLINGHKYIGQSNNIKQRWNKEKRVAFIEDDLAYDYPLSRAFRKYGIENFSFEVIEKCSADDLNKREKYWISYYDTFYNGYNQTLGGDGSRTQPKEKIIGIINDLENTDMYHREIAEKWQISQEMVQGINTGRYWFQENKDYPLQKKHKPKAYYIKDNQIITEKKHYYCIDCGVEIASSKAKRCVACAQKASRKVERPNAEDLYNYLVSIKGNFLQAGRHFGVSDAAVRKWCKKYDIPYRSSDYKNL